MKKLFYSALEVQQMVAANDLDKRKAELDARALLNKEQLEHAAALQRDKVAYDTLSQNSTRELNDYKLLAEKQRVVDKAECIVSIRNEYVVKLEADGRRIAELEAQVAEKTAMLSATNVILAQTVTDRSALLATVTSLAKAPVIVPQVSQTAIPAQVFMPGANTPIQIVK